MNERTSYFNQYVLQKKDYKAFVKDAIKTLSKKGKIRSPKELTYLYDDSIRRWIQDESHSGNVAETQKPDYFTENIYEELFVCLTHLRREASGGDDTEAKKKMFCAMIRAIKEEDQSLLENRLLFSFGLHYLVFSEGEDGAAFLRSKEEEVQKYFSKSFDHSFMDAALKCTYASCIFSMTEKSFDVLEKSVTEKYFKLALKAINEAIVDDREYATYHFLKARIMFWGLKNKIDEKFKLEDIRRLLDDAISMERSTDTGNRKRTQYLKYLSDVNLYEIGQKMEESEKKLQEIRTESEKKMQEIEEKSIKKMGAFSAFVSFAVGLLGKIVLSDSMEFVETTGFLLMLLGISFAIFTFFDFFLYELPSLRRTDVLTKCGSIVFLSNKENNPKKCSDSKVALSKEEKKLEKCSDSKVALSKEEKNLEKCRGSIVPWVVVIKVLLEILLVIVFLIGGMLIGFRVFF